MLAKANMSHEQHQQERDREHPDWHEHEYIALRDEVERGADVEDDPVVGAREHVLL